MFWGSTYITCLQMDLVSEISKIFQSSFVWFSLCLHGMLYSYQAFGFGFSVNMYAYKLFMELFFLYVHLLCLHLFSHSFYSWKFMHHEKNPLTVILLRFLKREKLNCVLIFSCSNRSLSISMKYHESPYIHLIIFLQFF